MLTADLIRDFYAYHFKINRKIWDQCIVNLPEEKFSQELNYGIGSIRNQIVHLMSVDERWFSGLRQEDLPDFPNPEQYQTREKIRAKWDEVEAKMREFLESLTDDVVTQPLSEGDALSRGQVLLHVVNHGTDHRAQILLQLNQMGVETFAQDYFFHIINRM